MFETIIADLAATKYSVTTNAISLELAARLRAGLRSKTFRQAGIGQIAATTPTIRNDVISWIEPSDLSEAERELFEFFESLRVQLNRELFLSLQDFEAHYARYDAGHFYKRHVDRFTTDGARMISVVLYLNESWSEQDGGELELFVEPPVLIKPLNATMVCFTSADIEHEVRPSNRERLSIAAWFRRSK